jgi:hypothetical protein
MNKALKWTLYVLLGLVVLAVLVGLGFLVFRGFGYGMMRPGFRMMEPLRYHSFSPFRAIFGGLLGLGVVVLVIVGIIALVNAIVRGNRNIPSNTPAQMAAPVRTCSNCGKPAQEDWKTCPYCGNPLT